MGPLVARLTWQSADPSTLGADLVRRLGTSSVPGLELVPWRRESPDDDPTAAGRLLFEPIEGGPAAPPAVAPPAAAQPLVAGTFDLAGVAWATVELDRAEADLARWLAPAARVLVDDVEPHLGARVRVRATASLPGAHLVLAEPATEGRLAASLARDGEGPCALYLRPAEGLDAWLASAADRRRTDSRVAPGPFGRSVLLPGSVAAGPHVIVVEASEPSSRSAAASTIAP